MDRGEEQFWVAVRRRIEDLGKTIGTRLRSGGLNNVRPHVSTCLHGGVSLMVKNCTLRTRWVRDDLWTDSQGTQFLASQTGTP